MIWKRTGSGDWREAAAKKGVMKACFPARVGPAFAVAEYRAPGGVSIRGKSRDLGAYHTKCNRFSRSSKNLYSI